MTGTRACDVRRMETWNWEWLEGRMQETLGKSSLAAGYEGQAGKSQEKRIVHSRHSVQHVQRSGDVAEPDSIEKLKENQNS